VFAIERWPMKCLQRPCIRLHESSLRSQQHGFRLNATKTRLHQVIACGHSVSLRSERMVRERPSFVDAEGRTFGMGNQRIDGPATECRLGFRPKCLICGDDILASSACCCLAACLYSLDTTRRLSVIPTGLVKTFTCVLQLLQPRAPPALGGETQAGPLGSCWQKGANAACQ